MASENTAGHDGSRASMSSFTRKWGGVVQEESYRQWMDAGESGELLLFGSYRKTEDITENFRPKKNQCEAGANGVETWKDILHVLGWASPHSHDHCIDH